MPYKIERRGKVWVIINKDRNEVVGHSETREKAEASVRARLAGEHNPFWKKGKKRGK